MSERVTSDWEGVNEQAFSLESPAESQEEVFLWLSCIHCGAKKRFVVTNALGEFVLRKTSWISYGSRCDGCGRKMKVTLRWEKPDSQWEATKREVEAMLGSERFG